MSMFCYQCQEAAKGTGCTIAGVCGKDEHLAQLQDALIFVTKGLSIVATEAKKHGTDISNIDEYITTNLFTTITNANFDKKVFVERIKKTIELRNSLDTKTTNTHLSVSFNGSTEEDFYNIAKDNGVLATENEDIRSLRELVIYGLKGMAAYAHHASVLGQKKESIFDFTRKALIATTNNNLGAEELTNLVLETGKIGVEAMALLDSANTGKYGNPEITEVNIGVKNNPAILISGHDLKDIEMLLEQTDGTGVDVYTHSEMLPAHYYPFFKKYSHFVGNYGNAWWKQDKEFASFNGPILMTTNCIVPVKDTYKDRIYTTGAAGFTGVKHIEADKNGYKDFSEIIAQAKTLPSPTEIETGKIIGGFAHNQVFALANKVVDAVKTGAIKKFIVMAGCDGRMNSRNYYTDFASALPRNTVILTAGCAKYRYNKLNLGDINGIPRVLDAGQCNDSYSLVAIALKLKEVFQLNDINELPIAYNIAWYEQKAVIVLLALLHLGVKNIKLGPTLPAFLSPNIARVLVDTFGINTIGDVEKDIKDITGVDITNNTTQTSINA